jgi:putative protease
MAESATSTASASAPPLPGAPVPLPELLAPAGDWECARAAVENGADAIYFGLDKFNARMRAHNFTEADLSKLMEFLHRRGVKGYVTFNTLVFADELAEAERYLRSIIRAGVDAAIVQDVGMCRLIRRLSPDFPIHASTQMTITGPAGVAFARELGCHLVVLARENSIKEIAAIQAAQSAQLSTLNSPNSQLPLEVFVHGALCVAYSGQCLTSESLGGRSANRGECAQACRMPYELISDGAKVDLGGRQYLLSPQDLSGLEVLPQLVRAGVASLKIEGRLKSPEYVASITRVYRKALEELRFTNDDLRAPDPAARKSEIVNRKYELEMSFSRGLHTGWFGGNDNQRLVHARFAKKRGVFLGEITGTRGEAVLARLTAPLKAGDGVVIDTGTGDDHEQGGRVFSLHDRGGVTQIAFRHGQINPRRVRPGDKLWKTDDPELNKRLRATFAGEEIRFQRPVHFEFHGADGAPLTVIARDDEGHVAQVASRIPLVPAEKHPLTDATLANQFGRLGGTPFKLGRVENRIEGALMLPLAETNRLRRDVVAELNRQRAQPRRWTLVSGLGSGVWDLGEERDGQAPAPRPETPSPRPDPTLVVLVRNLAQLESALRCGIETIYCEFEDPKKYREAVTLFHTARGCRDSSLLTSHSSPPSIWVAPPRITKPGEEWILKQVRSCNADGYLVRNYDHLQFFRDCRRIGDFSLNVANPLTAEHLIARHGLERVTASYDLNAEQLTALLRGAPPEWFEITLHQHMPMFHMEHCVFCAFLSKGKDYRDCGRPCDRHMVKLRDRVGLEHPLKADIGCRNTVFNARAQTGAEYYTQLVDLGVKHYRIEFVNETPAEVAATLNRYQALLRGEISGTQLWQELKLHAQLGVTRGQLDRAEVRQVTPKN